MTTTPLAFSSSESLNSGPSIARQRPEKQDSRTRRFGTRPCYQVIDLIDAIHGEWPVSVLLLLAQGPLTVGVMAKQFDLSYSKSSHILDRLLMYGLVRCQRERNFHHYALTERVQVTWSDKVATVIVINDYGDRISVQSIVGPCDGVHG